MTEPTPADAAPTTPVPPVPPVWSPNTTEATAPLPPLPPYAAAPAYQPPTYQAPTYQPPAYPTTPPAYAPYGTSQPYPGAPAPAPGYAPAGYGQGYGYAAPRPTNGLSVASLVLSILGFIWVLPFVGSLAGAIMGHVSLNQIKRTGAGGRGLALAGVIVGWAGVAITGLIVLFFIIAFASFGFSDGYYA